MLFLVHYIDKEDDWVLAGGDEAVSMQYIIAPDMQTAIGTAKKYLPNVSLHGVAIVAIHCAASGIMADGDAYTVDSDGWLNPG